MEVVDGKVWRWWMVRYGGGGWYGMEVVEKAKLVGRMLEDTGALPEYEVIH